MEQNTPKFRLRLNLFDGLVLLIALAVGAVLAWTALKPQAPVEAAPQNTATVRYTIRFQRMSPEAAQLVEEGDLLADNVKNYEMGKVTGIQAVPAQVPVVDHVNQRSVLAVQEGVLDLLVEVTAPCTATQKSITVGGGYEIRVGGVQYIRGQGYMASGPIVAMELEGAQ